MTQAIASIKESGVCSILLRLLLAVVFGGIIGTERGKHGRAAGMRTHILVCIGATMTTLIGEYVTFVLGMSSDPVRIGAQVISGIGFLGGWHDYDTWWFARKRSHNRSRAMGNCNDRPCIGHRAL